MATVPFNVMQEKVAGLYSGPSWRHRVYHIMSRSQVIAIYMKSLQDGSFDRAKKRKKVERENEKHSGHQINIFEWLKGDNK